MFDLDKISTEILCDLKVTTSKIQKHIVFDSPRSVGEAVQKYLAEMGLRTVLTKFGINNIETNFGRREMEDMAFEDCDGNYYAVDVKTHNLDTDFNMPNLTSVKRLAEFYKEGETKIFCILIVSYNVNFCEKNIEFKECHFKRIESFDWSCLTIGALGWGQIQIANAKNLTFVESTNRKEWMNKLCQKLQGFYEKEISKIEERKKWVSTIGKKWK